MIFLPGDFLVIGICIVVILIFRQFDRNNRSLEKVRRYADKVRNELDQIVAQKRTELRDLTIELEVQEKTDKEILKRIDHARQDMLTHADDLDVFNQQVAEYNERLEQLKEMSGRVDENLVRIRNESEYVDSVGTRLN